MKKLLFVISLTFLTFTIQQAFAQIAYGIRGGLNDANMRFSASGASESSYLGKKNSFHLGIIAEIPISERFWVQPGFYAIGKGFTFFANSMESDGSNTYYTVQEIKSNPLYLEAPLQVLTKINLRKSKITITAGPYIAYGISGKYKSESTTDLYDSFGNKIASKKESQDDVSYFSKSEFKRLDFGLGGSVGYEFKKGININLGYEAGLITADNADNGSLKNRSLSLSAGYLFNKNKSQ